MPIRPNTPTDTNAEAHTRQIFEQNNLNGFPTGLVYGHKKEICEGTGTRLFGGIVDGKSLQSGTTSQHGGAYVDYSQGLRACREVTGSRQSAGSAIPNADGELAAPLTSLSGLGESVNLGGAAGILGIAENLPSAIENIGNLGNIVDNIGNLGNIVDNIGNLGNIINENISSITSGITDIISGNFPINLPTDLASIIPPDIGNVLSDATAALQNLDLRQAGTNIPDSPIGGSAPASAVGSNCSVPTTRGDAAGATGGDAAGGAAGGDAAGGDGSGGPPGADLNNISGVSASDDLLSMIKGFEGYSEKVNPTQGNNSPVRPYWDFGQWSIGYGSYAGSRDRGTRPNVQWTPQQAEAELSRQLVPYRRGVEQINSSGNYQWTAQQLDALTSFAYNIGSINQVTGNATRSNREIADAMLLYNKAGGEVLPGLARRRSIEQQKFLAGMAPGRLNYRPGRTA